MIHFRPMPDPERRRLEGPWGTAWARIWCLAFMVMFTVTLIVVMSRPAPCKVVLYGNGTWVSLDAAVQAHQSVKPGCRLVWQP